MFSPLPSPQRGRGRLSDPLPQSLIGEKGWRTPTPLVFPPPIFDWGDQRMGSVFLPSPSPLPPQSKIGGQSGGQRGRGGAGFADPLCGVFLSPHKVGRPKQKRQKSKQKICKFYFFAEQKKATLLLQSKAKGTNQWPPRSHPLVPQSKIGGGKKVGRKTGGGQCKNKGR